MDDIITRYGRIQLINVTRGDWVFRITRIGDVSLEVYGRNRKEVESEARSLLRRLYNASKDAEII